MYNNKRSSSQSVQITEDLGEGELWFQKRSNTYQNVQNLLCFIYRQQIRISSYLGKSKQPHIKFTFKGFI